MSSDVVREMTPKGVVKVVCQFELAGLELEAVRVQREGELCVLGKEAIRRADEGDGRVIRSEKNWARIYKARNGIPAELDGNWLAAARPEPGDPRHVSGLYRGVRGRFKAWLPLDGGWPRDALVLRHHR